MSEAARDGRLGAEQHQCTLGEKAQKIHNPHTEFDVVKDSELSQTEKALENLEQDAHQLMTANDEGMAPENDHVAEYEPKLDEVAKAQQPLGEKPQKQGDAMIGPRWSQSPTHAAFETRQRLGQRKHPGLRNFTGSGPGSDQGSRPDFVALAVLCIPLSRQGIL